MSDTQKFMPTISVAMIVKNEAQDLACCLETVKGWVNEIIILDSGSSDNTCEIARSYGAKVYINTNWQGFGKQRQLAQQYVTSDYVLWLDADERVTPTLKTSILCAVKSDKPNVVYQVARLSQALGRKIYHSGWYPGYVVRLYKTKFAQYNDQLVHESVQYPKGTKVERLVGDLEHYTYKDLHEFLVKSANYSKAWAEQRAAMGKTTTLSAAILHAVSCFFKMYILRAGFLDGKQGFLLALLSANATLYKYVDLWERTKINRSPN